LIKFFGSTSRARILSLLLGTPEMSFYQREIMYETALSLQAVQRELTNLTVLEIIKREGTASEVYYRVCTQSPCFKPLREILGAFHG